MKLPLNYLVFILLINLSFISCKDNYISSIPDFPVSLELNLTTTYPNFRNSTNHYLTFTKPVTVSDRIGFGGILVYTGSSGDDNGNSIYYAFDMSCPYEHQSNIRVYPDLNSLGKVVCEKCGSVFDISYGIGNPSSGKAKEVLKRYKVTLVNNDILYVSR